jgi:2'-hydroxyisoflavone reductase
VMPWAGPKSLPLWLPETHLGFVARDTRPIADAGLRVRPVAETARAALEHERALGLDRERIAGLSADDERALLS